MTNLEKFWNHVEVISAGLACSGDCDNCTCNNGKNTGCTDTYTQEIMDFVSFLLVCMLNAQDRVFGDQKAEEGGNTNE